MKPYRGYDLRKSVFGIAIMFMGEWVCTVDDLPAAQVTIDGWMEAR